MGRESYVARGNKPYQQYFFRCIVPNDLREHFNQKEHFNQREPSFKNVSSSKKFPYNQNDPQEPLQT